MSVDGSFYEVMEQARQKYLLLTRRVPELPRTEAMVHHYFGTGEFESASFNAYYEPTFNTLCILPLLLTEKFFSASTSDAFNFGVASILGHEMAHGFDSEGAKYDKEGVRSNWWAMNDAMEFAERCQLLTECYNNLQVYPEADPDLYNNGALTLNENIADLGGFLTAFDAYTARLSRQGFYGEELEKQQRKFFESFAELQRSYYTFDYANLAKTSDHSLFRDRVNGVLMNVDAWYDLYDVQPGHKLYLSPSRRAYIW